LEKTKKDIERIRSETLEKIILNQIMESRELIQEILSIFMENPKKFYTPRTMYEYIQKRDTRFCANVLWRLWKQGFLTHANRRYYQWNIEK